MSAQAAAPPPRPLPPLSFLDGHGLLIRDADSLNARILQHLPMPASVTPAPARGFFHRSVIVGLGDVTLSDSLHGPLTFTAGGSDDVTLGPCHGGSARLRVDGRELTLDPAHGAVYLAGGGFQARTGPFHDMLLTLPRARLGRRLDAPLLFEPGDRRRADLLITLRRSLKLVDAPLLQAQGGLPLLHLDDLIVRLLTLMLWPPLQPGDTVSRIARRHDPSAFAAAFRREFRLTPSQLLREPGRTRRPEDQRGS